MKTLRLLALLTTAFLVTATGAEPGKPTPPDAIQLSISTDKPSYLPTEDIKVTVDLINQTDHIVTLDKFFAGVDIIGHNSGLKFVFTQNGKPVDPKYIHSEQVEDMMYKVEKKAIKSGEQLKFEVTLNRWYQLDGTGDFTVKAEYSPSMDGKVETFASDTVKFTRTAQAANKVGNPDDAEADAKRDLQGGTPKYYQIGLTAPHDQAWRTMLKQDYGIDLVLLGCVPVPPVSENANRYNAVVLPELKKKYGEDFLKVSVEKAKKSVTQTALPADAKEPKQTGAEKEFFDLEISFKTPHNRDFTMHSSLQIGLPFESIATNGEVCNTVSGTLGQSKDGKYPLNLTVSEWASEKANIKDTSQLELELGKAWSGGPVASLVYLRTVTLRKQPPSGLAQTPDAIDRLVAKLEAIPGHLWVNGVSLSLHLPETASPEQVVEQVFKFTGFDRGHVKDFKILKSRRVPIDNQSYTAALAQTDLGLKIVLYTAGGAWSRVYDADETTKNESFSPAVLALLDDLSLKCASLAWSEEFDRIERPETRPANDMVSGEASAYLADTKKRLVELGVKVKWNHEKKIYEVDESGKNATPAAAKPDKESPVNESHLEQSRFEKLNLRKGMSRKEVEEKVASLLGKPMRYAAYGNNLTGGTVPYNDGAWLLEVTYNPGAPAPWVKGADGSNEHLPPVDETVAEFTIKKVGNMHEVDQPAKDGLREKANPGTSSADHPNTYTGQTIGMSGTLRLPQPDNRIHLYTDTEAEAFRAKLETLKYPITTQAACEELGIDLKRLTDETGSMGGMASGVVITSWVKLSESYSISFHSHISIQGADGKWVNNDKGLLQEISIYTQIEVSEVHKKEDKVHISIHDDTLFVDAESPSGIGSARLALTSGNWPKKVVVRLRYAADKPFTRLEQATAWLEVPNPDPTRDVDDKSKQILDTRHLNAEGFEADIPSTNLKALGVSWIDAYRN